MTKERNNNMENTHVNGTQYIVSGEENELTDEYELMDEYISACIGIDEEGDPAFSYFAFGEQKYRKEDEEEEKQGTDDFMMIHVPIDIRVKNDLLIFDFDFSSEPEVLSELSEKIAVYESLLDIANKKIDGVLQDQKSSSEMFDDQRMEELFLQLGEIDIPYMYMKIVPRRYHGNICLAFDNEPRVISYTANKPLDVANHLVLVYSDKDLLIGNDGTIKTCGYAEE